MRTLISCRSTQCTSKEPRRERGDGRGWDREGVGVGRWVGGWWGSNMDKWLGTGEGVWGQDGGDSPSLPNVWSACLSGRRRRCRLHSRGVPSMLISPTQAGREERGVGKVYYIPQDRQDTQPRPSGLHPSSRSYNTIRHCQ